MFLLAATAFAADYDIPQVAEVAAHPASALWIGATPPSLAWVSDEARVNGTFGASVRMPSRVRWLQPELRVDYANSLTAFLPFPIPLPDDDHRVSAVFGGRFGLDHGFYGVGELGAAVEWETGGPAHLAPAVELGGGYAFRAGAHCRLSPELLVGSVNTLALRVEWGG